MNGATYLSGRGRETHFSPRAALEAMARCGESAPVPADGKLRSGVDLGTSTVVLTVVDSAGMPVFVAARACAALRDGVVVDFAGAVDAVENLVQLAGAQLDDGITAASVGYPPGIGPNESRACRFVLESAGLQCSALLDEVTAANAVVGITDGILVDVGAGSTGVGIILDGEVVAVGDVPGGGHHLNLILAGALATTVEQAEKLKKEEGEYYLPILRPGFERIAVSIRRLSMGYESLPLHLAGGGLMLPGAGDVIAEYLDRPVVEYPHALYITPLGLARSST